MIPEEITQARDAFFIAHSRTLFSWQQVEQTLGFIFQDLVKLEDSPDLIDAIFYSVDGLGIRLDMIGAAIKMRLPNNQTMRDKWGALYTRVKRQSRLRNRLAHYTFYQETSSRKRPDAAIRPSMFNPLEDHAAQQFNAKQVLGWGRDFGELAFEVGRLLPPD